MQICRIIFIYAFCFIFIHHTYSQESLLLRLNPPINSSYELQIVTDAEVEVFQYENKVDSMQMKFMAFIEDKVQSVVSQNELHILQNIKRCVFTLQAGKKYCYYDTDKESNSKECESILQKFFGIETKMTSQVGKPYLSILNNQGRILENNKEMVFFRAFPCNYDSIPIFPKDSVMFGYLWIIEDIEEDENGFLIPTKGFYEIDNVSENEIIISIKTYIQDENSGQYNKLHREGKIFLDRKTCMTNKFAFSETKQEILANGYKSTLKVLFKGFYKKIK